MHLECFWPNGLACLSHWTEDLLKFTKHCQTLVSGRPMLIWSVQWAHQKVNDQIRLYIIYNGTTDFLGSDYITLCSINQSINQNLCLSPGDDTPKLLQVIITCWAFSQFTSKGWSRCGHMACEQNTFQTSTQDSFGVQTPHPMYIKSLKCIKIHSRLLEPPNRKPPQIFLTMPQLRSNVS